MHLTAVLGVAHIDEIDNDDPAEVAQPELPGQYRGRFEIRFEQRVFLVVPPHKGARVHVNRGHGLGLIDDQMTATLKRDHRLQGALDVVLDTVPIKERALSVVVLHELCHLGHVLQAKIAQRRAVLAAVDDDTLDALAREIAHRAQRQGQVRVE